MKRKEYLMKSAFDFADYGRMRAMGISREDALERIALSKRIKKFTKIK